MKLTDAIDTPPCPLLYLRMGELVSSSGNDDFASHMFGLVAALVPIHRLDLAEWTVDEQQLDAAFIKVLGKAGSLDGCPPPETLRHPLLPRIMQMNDPLLIQLKVPLGKDRPQGASQCSLVSRRGNRRWVIGCHRAPGERAFSLSELALLKSLSDTLLPLVEHHAQLLQGNPSGVPLGSAEAEPDALRRALGQRLEDSDVRLSAREQDVCLGLLTGETLAEMARRLNVKISSVETYLKRASAKLGVSGRHGVARWMARDWLA